MEIIVFRIYRSNIRVDACHLINIRRLVQILDPMFVDRHKFSIRCLLIDTIPPFDAHEYSTRLQILDKVAIHEHICECSLNQNRIQLFYLTSHHAHALPNCLKYRERNFMQ